MKKVIFMNVIDTVNIINKSYKKIYEDFDFSFTSNEPEIAFTSGYYYDFFCLLNRFYPKY